MECGGCDTALCRPVSLTTAPMCTFHLRPPAAFLVRETRPFESVLRYGRFGSFLYGSELLTLRRCRARACQRAHGRIQSGDMTPQSIAACPKHFCVRGCLLLRRVVVDYRA